MLYKKRYMQKCWNTFLLVQLREKTNVKKKKKKQKQIAKEANALVQRLTHSNAGVFISVYENRDTQTKSNSVRESRHQSRQNGYHQRVQYNLGLVTTTHHLT